MSKVAAVLEQRSGEPDASVVREELLQMLGRIGNAGPRPEPVSSPAAAAVVIHKKPEPEEATKTAEDDTGCPQCGSREPWGTASWCPSCGYYPSIGHEGRIVEATDEELPELSLMQLIPGWFWYLVAGVAVIIGVTIGLYRMLSATPGFVSLASLIQLSFGALLLLTAHIGACLSSLRYSQMIGIKEYLFYPPAVWLPALKRLPETSNAVTNFTWGLTAIVAALCILGPIKMDAIQRDLQARKKPKTSAMKTMLGAASAMSTPMQGVKSDATLEEAMDAFAGQALEAGDISSAAGPGRDGMNSLALGADPSTLEAKGDPAEGGGPNSGTADGTGGTTDPNDPKNAAQGLAAPDKSPLALGKSSNKPDAALPPEAQTTPTTPKTTGKPGAAPTAAATRTTPKAKESAEDFRRSECVVFGYLTNSEGTIRSLLLATSDSTTRPRYVARLPLEALPADMQATLIEALPTIRTARPIAACPYGGRWVEPAFNLAIRHSGWSNSTFQEPVVEAMVRR